METILEGPPDVSNIANAIRTRLDVAKDEIKQAESALSKFERDPRKYKPQLRNLRQSLKTLSQVGRITLKKVDSLEKLS